MKKYLILGILALVLVAGCVQSPTGNVIDQEAGQNGQGQNGEQGSEEITVADVTADPQSFDGMKITLNGYLDPYVYFDVVDDQKRMGTIGEGTDKIWIEGSVDHEKGNFDITGTIESVKYCSCVFWNGDFWALKGDLTAENCEKLEQQTYDEYKCKEDTEFNVAFMDVESIN